MKKKQSFIALDVGLVTVRAFGFANTLDRPRHFLHTETGNSIKQNIINAIDAVEENLDAKFESATITGNFGFVESEIYKNTLVFPWAKSPDQTDVYNAIFGSKDIRKIERNLLHLIPLEYRLDGAPSNGNFQIRANKLEVTFNAITCPNNITDEIKQALRSACIPPANFFDIIYLLGKVYHKKKTPAVFIDFSRSKTAVGIFKNGALAYRFDITPGQDEVTKRLEEDLGVSYDDAEEIKKNVTKNPPSQTDAYTSASPKYKSLTTSDVWEVWFDVNNEIVERIIERAPAESFDLFITGAGINPDNIKSLILRNKGLDAEILTEHAAAAAAFKITKQTTKRSALPTGGGNPGAIRRRRNIPIMPGVSSWNIKSSATYKMFESVGIREIHYDLGDGFYTQKVRGSLEELRLIRSKTRLFMHTHLMVEDSKPWTEKALEIGCDTIILSTGSRNLAESLRMIKLAKRRAGLALHPEFDLRKLKPEILYMLDEVMIMSVTPGGSGQAFLPKTPARIKTMANTRDKYQFRYRITVDGGINADTAPLVWAAGADALVSENYLKNAPDFADALVSLLKK